MAGTPMEEAAKVGPSVRPDPLVGRLACSPAFMPALPVVRQRSLGVRRGATDRVAIIGPSSPTAALAVPHERGRLAAPGAGRLLEPGADLGRARGMLPSRARRLRMRWIDSAMFSQLPPS